eukprot:3880827-Pyramimonas_sp.AAC.1
MGPKQPTVPSDNMSRITFPIAFGVPLNIMGRRGVAERVGRVSRQAGRGGPRAGRLRHQHQHT